MRASRDFFKGDPSKVAQNLLGHELVHRTEKGEIVGRIVETEAYFGVEDPASRASENKTEINRLMWKRPGISLVYMVHANWLFNVVSESEGTPGAVLIRALEPVIGMKVMRSRRGLRNLEDLTSGPGKLTEALGISKDHHGMDLAKSDSLYIRVSDSPQRFDVGRSNRVGVTEDLDRKLRFFIKGNENVSD